MNNISCGFDVVRKWESCPTNYLSVYQSIMSPYLSLLADDGDSILQFDIMEKALQKYVGHSYQVVVLLCLIEWVTAITVCHVILKKQRKT